MMDNKDELIDAQSEYIKFLSDYIDKFSVYLHFHDMSATTEEVSQGIEFRDKIDELQKLINKE